MKAHTIPAAQLPGTPALLRRNLRASHSSKFLTLSSLISPSTTTHLKSEIDVNKLEFPDKQMFILGMGYVGQFFAEQLKNEGWDVAGTCMSVTKKKVLEQKGFDIHVFDAMEPRWKFLDTLRCCTHLLVSIPPTVGIGDPILQHEETFKASLADRNLRWLCYLSITSIYGDAGGAWVDENSNLPKPSNNLAKMRVKSEEGWLKLGQDLGLSTYVFRLGGIYGPGRSAIDTILKKEELSERQKRRATINFTSRVHVADICQAKASISTQVQRKIYNVVDDDPASRTEVFAFAQQLIEQRWPGLIDTFNNSINSKLSGGAEKRVSNACVKKELGIELLYPSYRSGLQSITDTIENPISHCG